MVAPATKLLPVMVNVKAASPAVLLEGESALMLGTGLLTVKFSELELLVPALETETAIVAAVAISAALMVALTWVASTMVAA